MSKQREDPELSGPIWKGGEQVVRPTCSRFGATVFSLQSCDTVKPGGTISLLIQNTTELRSEFDRIGKVYADHVIDCYNYFIKTGFIPVQRINIPLTWEQFAGFDVKEAKDKKRLLGVVRDLLIMKKEAVS